MRTLAVDPGLRGCGVALFDDDNRLAWATWLENPTKAGRGPAAWDTMARAMAMLRMPAHQLVCEMPQVYPGMPKTDINDLLDLAGVLGALVGYLAPLESIEHCYPADWKGQVPKKIMNARVGKFLSEDELKVIKSVGAKDHNTWDAIGIGLFFLGRMKKGGT